MKKSTLQSGQTLIETIVASSVLVVGIIGGLSPAIYSFTNISSAATSDVAAGLAREGLEATRRLRDSNWLAGTLADCGGYFCYQTWLTAPYDLSGSAGAGTEYRVIFDPEATGNKWTLAAAGGLTDFRLYIQPGGEYSHTATASPSPFFRKVAVIYASDTAPYDATSPLVLVRSTVWWIDRRCAEVADPANTLCKIVSEAYLSNWKNY